VHVDVISEIEIARERRLVAAYAADPDKAATWCGNIKSVRWLTPRPLWVHSQLEITADLLQRRRCLMFEVIEYVPHRRLVVQTPNRSRQLRTTYTWRDSGQDATHMTLRHRAETSRLFAPVVARAIRRVSENDLRRLKTIFEARLPFRDRL
jgi:hypothetical protein